LFNFNYGSNHPSITNYFVVNIENETSFKLYDTIQWKKSAALPNNVSPNRLTRITEPVFVFAKTKDFVSNKQVKSQSRTGQNFYENVFNFIVAPNNDGSNNLNKATFSTELVTQLLNLYVPQNETSVIFDPFGGIGTTAKACDKYGVQWISSELDKEQVDFFNNKTLLK
jgi:site-specific DNA-methyltransferase (adenine-specific)